MNEAPRKFRLLGSVRQVELIAEGRGIRIIGFLRATYGGGHWRKMKGRANVEEDNGWIGEAEIHWYEAHGVGKVRWKIKRELDR